VPSAPRPTTEAEAIAWIVDRVPELRSVLDEHLADNYGEVLTYLAFENEFLRWFVDRVRAGDHDPAERFVAAIEPLMTTDVEPPSDDRVWNLAAVCFVEALVTQASWDDVIETARAWMGPNTMRDIDQMFRYRSGELPPTA
jgi:hypothetical protein